MNKLKTINDSKIEGLQNGQTEIWYSKSFREMCGGLELALHFNFFSNIEDNLSKTHILLGTVTETNKEDIFNLMQGDIWSPNGEARELISELGLTHTSMSVGDIIKVNDEYFMVDDFGFKLIKWEK